MTADWLLLKVSGLRVERRYHDHLHGQDREEVSRHPQHAAADVVAELAEQIELLDRVNACLGITVEDSSGHLVAFFPFLTLLFVPTESLMVLDLVLVPTNADLLLE